MIIRSPKELAALATNQRKKIGLTQCEVADKVGLQQKTISAFENRPASVKLATALRIVSALDLDLELKSKQEYMDNIGKWEQEW